MPLLAELLFQIAGAVFVVTALASKRDIGIIFWHVGIVGINNVNLCPAEPGYTLPL